MSSFVLPLPGGSSSPVNKRPTMDDAEGLISWLDTHNPVRQMLDIREDIAHGVYRTSMENILIVGQYKVSWGEVLNKAHLDSELAWDWGKFEPTKEDWHKYHLHIKTLVSYDLSNALGTLVTPDDFVYRIRKKGKNCNLYNIIFV